MSLIGGRAMATRVEASVTVLDVEEITVRFGGIIALDRASFSIEQGQICGLIGPNGAGKTTMFNVISRIYDPTSGSITFDGQGPAATRARTGSPSSASSARSRTSRCGRA